MSYSIALSGKGGTGKTTIAAMIVRRLAELDQGAVLAVDADPNSNLGLLLGVEVPGTIADVREDVLGMAQTPVGMSKDRMMELQIQQSLVEGQGFDLVTMGRPEGPKCYCFVNHLLREFLNAVSKNYGFVVIDNEAGMEHLSRRTTNNVDALLVVAVPSYASLLAAQRVLEISEKLPIMVGEKCVIMNRASQDGLDRKLTERITSLGIELFGCVSDDAEAERIYAEGGTIFTLSGDAPAYGDVCDFLEKLIPDCHESAGNKSTGGEANATA